MGAGASMVTQYSVKPTERQNARPATTRHALSKLRDAHRVAMTFVRDELYIHPGELA